MRFHPPESSLLRIIVIRLLTHAGTRLVLSLLVPNAKAQSNCCSVQPPLEDNYLVTSWPKGKTVSIKVQESFGNEAKAELDAGIRSWNSFNTAGCSGVNFAGATLAAFAITDPIPDYTIRVNKMSPNNGSIGAIIVRKGGDGRAINADILISPAYTFSGLKYLGAHETGHSHGMKNCNSCPLGTSIMTSYNESQTSPTQCDVQVVGKIYCTCPAGGTYRTCKECAEAGGYSRTHAGVPRRRRVPVMARRTTARIPPRGARAASSITARRATGRSRGATLTA